MENCRGRGRSSNDEVRLQKCSLPEMVAMTIRQDQKKIMIVFNGQTGIMSVAILKYFIENECTHVK